MQSLTIVQGCHQDFKFLGKYNEKKKAGNQTARDFCLFYFPIKKVARAPFVVAREIPGKRRNADALAHAFLICSVIYLFIYLYRNICRFLAYKKLI